MKLQLKELIEGVRSIAGLPASGSVGGIPTAERNRFDRVIANIAVAEACELIQSLNRNSDFTEVMTEVSWRTTPQGDYVGTLRLPDDCLIPAGIRFPDRAQMWDKIIWPDCAEHWQRYSSFPEISGDADHPRLYIVDGFRGKCLEIHRCRNDYPGVYLYYLKRPQWENGEMEIPAGIETTLVLRTGMRLRDLLR